MNKLLVVVESAEGRNTEVLWGWLSASGDDVCHILSSLAVIKTEKDVEELGRQIQNSGWFTTHDRYLIAAISGSWLAHNCKSGIECFG